MNEDNRPDLLGEWKPYDVYQNREFAEIHTKHLSNEMCKICGNQAFIYKIPFFGYLKMRVYVSKDIKIDEFLEESLDVCSQKKIPQLEIVTLPANELNKYPYESRGTYVIDLNQSDEKLWSNVQKKTRQKIRQAEKRGTVIKQTKSMEDFEKWWEIYKVTGERGSFGLMMHDFAVEVFKNENISRLFVTVVNDKIIAGIILLFSNDAMPWIGGSLRESPESRATELLQWEMIRWSKKMNFRFYDMGGAVKEGKHGPTEFKRHFGGEFKDIYIYKIEINKIKSKLINAAIKLRFTLKKSF